MIDSNGYGDAKPWESAWAAQQRRDPISTYVTASDIAFTVVVFECYIDRWNFLAAATRRGTPVNRKTKIPPLYYEGGIAGADAKGRYQQLLVYFRSRFFMKNSSIAARNMKQLQFAVDKAGPPTLGGGGGIVSRQHSLDDIVGDILHRVFYELHL